MFRKLWLRWNPFIRMVPKPKTFEYSESWAGTSRKARQLNPRCCVNPLLKADVTHHLKYTRSKLRRLLGYLFLGHDFGASVAGYEIVGWDVVTVSSRHHDNYYGKSSDRRSVHYFKVWVQHQGASIDNHQTTLKAFELRLRFWLIVLILHGKVYLLIGGLLVLATSLLTIISG